MVKPYLAPLNPEILFPEPLVRALSLERTFWEKATLVHVECMRPRLRDTTRMSRHWYDLFRMSSDIEQFTSRQMNQLLASVVRHKKAFFNYSFAAYDQCLSGGLRLVPGGELQRALSKDFAEMQDAGMFYQDPPSFSTILEHLQRLEKRLNEMFQTYR
ncbi:MAG: nucleotidyl transferase AbiEii/AbiGii toxin family protein [Candidatus Competibacteraceae bacterium]|nr:nucleotidyl transferase AbiEii/AbiGii toxin family protein [Candidatus Competibacteraceae bacterium]